MQSQQALPPPTRFDTNISKTEAGPQALRAWVAAKSTEPLFSQLPTEATAQIMVPHILDWLKQQCGNNITNARRRFKYQYKKAAEDHNGKAYFFSILYDS